MVGARITMEELRAKSAKAKAALSHPEGSDKRYGSSRASDATPDHDAMLVWVLRNWKRVIIFLNPVYQSLEGNIEASPLLREDYATPRDVRPDAKVCYHFTRHNVTATYYEGTHDPDDHEDCSRNDAHTHLHCLASNHVNEVRDGDQSLTKWGHDNREPEGMVEIVEVKPYFFSFTRELEQLKEYRRRTGTSVILVTSDTRFDIELKEQGITVYHPPVAEISRLTEELKRGARSA